MSNNAEPSRSQVNPLADSIAADEPANAALAILADPARAAAQATAAQNDAADAVNVDDDVAVDIASEIAREAAEESASVPDTIDLAGNKKTPSA